MFIHQLPDVLPDLLEARQYAPRTGAPSAHISAIIKSLCMTLDPKRFGGEVTEAVRTRWEIGLAFEDVLGQVLADRFLKSAHNSIEHGPQRWVRPGEYTDPATGIIGTPDIIDTQDEVVEEWKATWMSSRQPIDHPKYWHWLVQLQAYLKLTGYRTGRLRVLHVNGDYSHREGAGPEFKCYEILFQDREIDENWRMLVNEARAKGMLP